MTGPIARRIAFLFAGATGLAAHTNAALADTGPCHSMEYEDAAYTVCEVDLRRHTVRLYWNRPDGTPYAYLSALPRELEGGETGYCSLPTPACSTQSSSPWACMWNRGRNSFTQTPSREKVIST